LALELLKLPYNSDSYRFVSEEIKQTGFRIDGLFKPADDTEYPLIFAEVQYQPDSEFYGRFFSEIALYLYRQKPARTWLAMVVYPSRNIEKPASIAFEPFTQLPQLHRVYLDDYQNLATLTPSQTLLSLIVCQNQQTIEIAQKLVKQRTIQGIESLNFVETVLVYKLPHLTREEIKTMLGLDTELKKNVSTRRLQKRSACKGAKLKALPCLPVYSAANSACCQSWTQPCNNYPIWN
jgi:predicted transposase/invertase (TIGR01784 family)